MAIQTDVLAESIEAPLARLLAFEPGSLPVLSVYLDTRPDQHGRAADAIPYLHREFKALAETWPPSAPERHSFDADAARVLAFVTDDLAATANGVAIFACSGAGLFETLQLTAPFEATRIHVCDQPHLYQLVRMDERFPKYAAVLTDANAAMIFTFALGQTLAEDGVNGHKVHRVKVGGWSQARYQRRAANAHEEHAKEIVARLQQIVHEDAVDHIVIAGDSVIVPLLLASMPPELASMVETAQLGIHASEHEILDATLAVLQEHQAVLDGEKVEHLLQQFRAGGLAVTGLDATRAALANGQVEELLISSSLEDGPDRFVTLAKQTDAAVTFVDDPALLQAAAGVGAFLRWRA
ncbi:MAG TPA: Vms1/Ankzf1 family peptidyl-tRNA hydrolase [Terriglobales bacterium]|nr:Vms1/Ankzf1 family peptidyl-tRNA hydrolase [Terriglobales bacterium]